MDINSPRISVVKSKFEDYSENMEDSQLVESINLHSTLIQPPIPANATYEPTNPKRVHPLQDERSQKANTTNGTESWDYENYIEQPRAGHVAQPRYVKPNDSANQSYENFDEPTTDFTRAAHTSTGLSPALLTILAYFFGWLGGLIVMLVEKKNLFVIFHGWQSFIVGVISFIVQLLFVWSSFMYTLLWLAYLVFTFVMILKIIQDAPSQRLFKLPWIGDWCEQRAHNKIQFHSAGGNFVRV